MALTFADIAEPRPLTLFMTLSWRFHDASTLH